MKRDQLKKLREKSVEELKKELQLSKDNLWQLKLDLASGKVKNVREIRSFRKAIAVINTILNK